MSKTLRFFKLANADESKEVSLFSLRNNFVRLVSPWKVFGSIVWMLFFHNSNTWSLTSPENVDALRYSILFLSKFSFSTFVKTSNVPGVISVILLQHKSNATALFFSNVGYHIFNCKHSIKKSAKGTTVNSRLIAHVLFGGGLR